MNNSEPVKVISSFRYNDRVELALAGNRKITLYPAMTDIAFYNTIQTNNVINVKFGEKDMPDSVFCNGRKVYPI